MKSLQGIKLSYQLQTLVETCKENSPSQSAPKYVYFLSTKKIDQITMKENDLHLLCVTNYRRVPDTPSKKGAPKCSVASALQESEGIARGFRLKEGEPPGALNGFLYSLLRGTKQQRRALVLSMLKQFDENSKNPLAQLLYLADNLAAFPYQVSA